ncbi:hypothetical protein LPJ66_008348, partial [Kickxella alabastrina]
HQQQHVSPGGPGFSGVNAFVSMQQRHNDGTVDANVNGFNIQNSSAAISPQQASQTMSPVMTMTMAPPFSLIPNSTVHAANTMTPTTANNAAVTPTAPSNPTMLAMATAAAAPADAIGSNVKKAPIRTRARRVPRKPTAAKTAANAVAAAAKLASDSQPPPSPANQGTVANGGSGNSNNNKSTSSPALAMKAAAAMPNSARGFSVAISSPSFANATALVNNSGHGPTQAAVNTSVTEAEARASGAAGSFVENAFSKMLSQRGNQATLQGGAVGIPKNNADMPSAMGPIDVDGLNLNINQWLRGGESSDALDNLLSIGMPMNGVPSVAGSAGAAGGDHGGQAASSQIVSPYDISDTALADLITSSGGIVSGNGGGNQGLPGALSTSMSIPVNMAMPSTSAAASALTAAGNVGRTTVDSGHVSTSSNGGVNAGNGILSNHTGETGHIGFQATFDRSDYAYPLPQTGLSTFGFAGELYVPENASCADDVLGTSVREYTRPNHPNSIAFLPYRSCRATWEWILHQEMQAGRAVGAIIYSMKDDAAHAAERAVIDLTYLHMPVWVVNADTGKYLTNAMKQIYTSDPGLTLPLPPANVMYQNVQDDVRAAMRAAKETLTQNMPWVFITISRSAANVATADRNFFLKAMIGVGITGIVCFFIAMIVRYFDCLCFGCIGQRQLRNQRGVWPYGAGELDGLQERGFGSHSVMATARRRSDHGRRVHERGTAMPREKRVLKQHELDAMPCKVISLYDLMPEGEKPVPVVPAAPAVPVMAHYGMNLHAITA